MEADLLLVLPSLFLSSLVVTGVITPIFRKIAIKFEVWDSPNAAHKTHKEPVPYLGGLAIILGVTVVVFLGIWISGNFKSTYLLVMSCLLPAIFMAFVGLLDDILNLSPWPRFVAQTLAGLATSWVLIQSDTKGALFNSDFINIVITVIWIVGLCNAVNFFDNIDGGASGSIAISTAGISVISLISQQYYVGALASVVSGACLGFLLWNRNPAKIYMGDAGSLFLGVLVATLAIRIDTQVTSHELALIIPLLILALPVLDTTLVVISRIIRGVSPFQGGRDHVAHLMLASGNSKKQTVIALWLLSLLFAVLAILITISSSNLMSVFIAASGVLVWLVLLGLFLLTPLKFQSPREEVRN